MGGTPEEIQAVAGFAGGLGLSGNGCGALAAALYQKALSLAKENPKRNLYSRITSYNVCYTKLLRRT